MPTSNVTRVRSDGFSKIIARNRPASAVSIALRMRLDVRGQAKQFAHLRGAPFRAGQQIGGQAQSVAGCHARS